MSTEHPLQPVLQRLLLSLAMMISMVMIVTFLNFGVKLVPEIIFKNHFLLEVEIFMKTFIENFLKVI